MILSLFFFNQSLVSLSVALFFPHRPRERTFLMIPALPALMPCNKKKHLHFYTLVFSPLLSLLFLLCLVFFLLSLNTFFVLKVLALFVRVPLRPARPGHVEALAAALVERDEQVGAEVARGEVDARRVELLLRIFFFLKEEVERKLSGKKKKKKKEIERKKTNRLLYSLLLASPSCALPLSIQEVQSRSCARARNENKEEGKCLLGRFSPI